MTCTLIGRKKLGPAAFVTSETRGDAGQRVVALHRVPTCPIRIEVDWSVGIRGDQLPPGVNDARAVEYGAIAHSSVLVGLVENGPLVAVSVDPLGDDRQVLAWLDMVTIGAGSRGAAAAVGTPASATLTTMPPAREVWTALRTSGPLKKSAVIRTRRTTLAPAATRSAAVATSCRHRLRTSHAQISQPRLPAT